MTKIKHTEAHVINGKESNIVKTTYYEVGAFEVRKMFKEIEKGGNEKDLRKQLIAESIW